MILKNLLGDQKNNFLEAFDPNIPSDRLPILYPDEFIKYQDEKRKSEGDFITFDTYIKAKCLGNYLRACGDAAVKNFFSYQNRLLQNPPSAVEIEKEYFLTKNNPENIDQEEMD